MAMPTGRIAGLVSRPQVMVRSITSRIDGRACWTPRILVRVGSWQTTKASGWAPCSRPSDTPEKEGWNSEPWPSTTSQWVGAPAGDSHSTAPEMKSATTASIAAPRPEMNTPVWPVARKSASRPRARISFSIAKAVYFLPTEQSVPTVRRRRPGRLVPLPVAKRSWVKRTSCSLRPCAFAAAATSGIEARRTCRPVATSMPASSAATIEAIQWSGSTPPALATPTIMVLTPAAAASAMLMSGRLASAAQPGRRSWPRHHSGRQSTMPRAVLAASASATSPRKSR